MGELAEADAADAEESKVAAIATADAASVVLTHLEFGRSFLLYS